MERLLRVLIAARGLILAGTLILAGAEYYFDAGSTSVIDAVNGHGTAQGQALTLPPAVVLPPECPVPVCFRP
jgi:hypothetical protein